MAGGPPSAAGERKASEVSRLFSSFVDFFRHAISLATEPEGGEERRDPKAAKHDRQMKSQQAAYAKRNITVTPNRLTGELVEKIGLENLPGEEPGAHPSPPGAAAVHAGVVLPSPRSRQARRDALRRHYHLSPLQPHLRRLRYACAPASC